MLPGARELVGEGCGKPLETCLSFDGAALNTARSGVGRLITVEEAIIIVEKAKRAGLVLQPANSQNPIFLCMCCSCCCGVLRHLKLEPNPGSMVASAFIAFHDELKCALCGACVEICPMEALTSDEDGSILFDEPRCIGCGLCVSVCPSESMQLKRKEPSQLQTTPRNTLDTYYHLAKAGGRWHSLDMASMVVRSYVDRMLAPK